MLIETMWLLPVAAIYLFAIADSSTSHMGQNPMSLNLLLIAAGCPMIYRTAVVFYRRCHALASLNVRLFPVHWPDADVPAGCDVLW
ncbi:hypothetical protein ACLK2A_20910 [Escherichia coli]